ncbi:DNA repair ATPase [Fulvivirgaceae bacterium BMA12]|uniref:DNA repair ATPase n=1 Tax=Agaribacillus aureus TaxID=3051825 RepID=A0ABT8L0U8_9BACT|nr:DNA repair ATPase [Fulvivirgaceae bacterium BMA12]
MTEKKANNKEKNPNPATELEAGTYEILSKRLQNNSLQLREKLSGLNESRKEVFGSIDTALITTERINTEHNCIPWDMEPIGNHFIFGYNVHIGLKVEMQLADVFSIYTFRDHGFHTEGLEMIADNTFIEDFRKLYKYYKNTRFVKFARIENHLFMIFRVGKGRDDIKTFKWLINGLELVYVDNRSDHEYVFPNQHEFNWEKTNRDFHREGEFPHISIEDKVFVETIGGDLTIKIEDNTDEGKGIYSEKVENIDQRLEDAEIYYTILGNIIILKIRPYQEKNFRYIVYNAKLKEARRIDALKDACVLLPDDYGIIFSNGYYLKTGEFKQFDNQLDNMYFERRIASPNGEDFLYVFYNKDSGIYLLLPYNIIEQKVNTPLTCHGYSIFENGELIILNADDAAKKHHTIQIWQTPYTGPNFQVQASNNSYLYKIGNKEIVKAMAECHEVISLIEKGDDYENLYADLIGITGDLKDSYHWIAREEAHNLASSLSAIHETASSAISEFEKVSAIRKNTREQVALVSKETKGLINRIKRQKADTVNAYVLNLQDLRNIRGKLISLKELRYADLEAVEGFEKEVETATANTSRECIKFLLKKDALAPYAQNVTRIENAVKQLKKIVEANQLAQEIADVSAELELLIEIVTNLKIEDATETTRIVDNISTIYSGFNKIKADLKNKRILLLGVEGKAEFNAQMKLVDQGLINYLDICDKPEKCDEYLTRLMVQLEELEGKFSEFDEFIDKISLKREEVYNGFETRKIALIEAQTKRANTLMQAADRILGAVKSRVSRFESIDEINGYYAGDLMIEKVRDIITSLVSLGDTVKSDEIQSRLKAVREEAVRQLKDKKELFLSGENIIQFGNHKFSVNTQPLSLTIVPKGDNMYFHLTGTNFFEKIDDAGFNDCKAVWDQAYVSENPQVYKGEYLAYKIIKSKPSGSDTAQNIPILTPEKLIKLDQKKLRNYVQQFMATRYHEAYIKGVHDHDAIMILNVLLKFLKSGDLLRYSSEARACATLYWKVFISEESKNHLNHQLKGVGTILKVFPETREFDDIKLILQREIEAFVDEAGLFDRTICYQAAEYLFHEVNRGDKFVIDVESARLYERFFQYLGKKKAKKEFDRSTAQIATDPLAKYRLIQHWLRAFVRSDDEMVGDEYINETATIILTDSFKPNHVIHVALKETLQGLLGTHTIIKDKRYELDYNAFTLKLDNFEKQVVPKYHKFLQLKKQISTDYSESLRLEEFRPRILSSFVRNQLIDRVYLPLIGANLAKQIGTVGENKRTDLMGMLLLISPPGYGKTTLMEYIANRLGLIFMKINGPAIGHQVTAVDPAEATNAGAREELEKLNLAFEMGDNVMIYLDDIQHCNPEFLQKFISLCDGQRKIEGIYKGKSKTYDFKGKKVCVVMAGNPYTESGEKFSIPDMLANRADIYNLGDIIGDNAGVFKLSYLENCLTSNPVMNKLAGKSQQDLYTMIKIAETGNREGLDFDYAYSATEIEEYVNVLKKLLKVRDIILKVNMAYIYSAAQADEYRTEPPFKLQGSYRDMNKIAEKVVPVMNEKELATLIDTHYENEVQTLTTGAEANLLKYKELQKALNTQDQQRWDEIKKTFVRKQQLSVLGGQNQVGQVLLQMEHINDGLKGIISALIKDK